jgi:hypothetical protein
MAEFNDTSYNESVQLYKLALTPGQAIERVRRDILPSVATDSHMWIHRHKILRYFDAFARAGRVMKFSEFTPEPKPPVPPKPPRLTKFDDAAIVEAIKQGLTNIEIARKFGCSRAQGSRLARRHRLPRQHGKRLSEKTRQIILAIRAGETRKEISRRFQVRGCYIWHIQKRFMERVNA